MKQWEKDLLFEDFKLFSLFMSNLTEARLLFQECLREDLIWMAEFYAEMMRIYTIHSVHMYHRVKRELGCS